MNIILRTAVGSPVAPFILKHLKENINCRLIGVDIDTMACGFSWCDQSYIVKRVKEKGYIEEILSICKKENVNIFWPDLDEELVLVAQNRSKFEDLGIAIVLSDEEVLKICTDKFETYRFFKDNEIPTPNSYINDPPYKLKLPFPFIIKPINGRGSQGVHKIENEEDFQYYSKRVNNTIVQEMLLGVEYTIDTLSDNNGLFHYGSIRERIATDSGISIKGKTVKDNELLELAEKICNKLKIKGPACIQCFKDAQSGKIGFIEINPRIAGTAAISVLAGAQLIQDSINVFSGNPIVGMVNYKYGLSVSRYWSEVVVNK